MVLILVGKNAFLALFWAYVGQPDDHIGWATLMPFASIYSTNPKTKPWNFHEKILRIGGVEKLSFLSRIFWFLFASSPVKPFKISWIASMGWYYDDCPGF